MNNIQKKWEKYYKTNTGSSQEGYTYVRNQPKNRPEMILNPTVENYNYGYSYAMYKPEKHQTQPNPQEEKKWQGVL